MKSELAQAAIEYANGFRQRANSLVEELRAAKLKVSEIQAHLDATNLAIERSNNFRPDIRGEVQCPFCWIAQGHHVALSGQPSDTDDDWFRCANGHEFISPT